MPLQRVALIFTHVELTLEVITCEYLLQSSMQATKVKKKKKNHSPLLTISQIQSNLDITNYSHIKLCIKYF